MISHSVKYLVAPGTRREFVGTLDPAEIEWAPAPGGLAYWGAIKPEQTAVISIPSRVGFLETAPRNNPVVADVAPLALDLIEGGNSSLVLVDGVATRGPFRARPGPELIAWFQATDYVRRRIAGLKSVTVIQSTTLLGTVAFLGSSLAPIDPPIPGLPGLSAMDVPPQPQRKLLDPIVTLVAGVGQGDGEIPTSRGGEIPKRRIRVDSVWIP